MWPSSSVFSRTSDCKVDSPGVPCWVSPGHDSSTRRLPPGRFASQMPQIRNALHSPGLQKAFRLLIARRPAPLVLTPRFPPERAPAESRVAR
jgi:hypothetical protein